MSIAMQNISDIIQVTIVDDNSSVDYKDLTNTFNKLLDIQYIKLQNNQGVGHARKVGFESTTCPYVTYIDSDDTLYNEYSLYLLYKKVINTKCDFVCGNFIREFESSESCLPSQLKLSKVPGKNQTWVFARLFSRDYLVSHNIYFSDMRYNEDVSYMQLCLCQSTNIEYIDNTVYVQHYNEKSLTHSKDNEFHKNAQGLINFVNALSYAHSKKRKLGLIDMDKSEEQAADGLSVSYWYFIQCYNEESTETCEKYLEALQEFYNMVTDDYPEIITSDLLKKSYFTSLNSMKEISNKYIPTIGFQELLDDLKNNKNEPKDISDYGYELG